MDLLDGCILDWVHEGIGKYKGGEIMTPQKAGADLFLFMGLIMFGSGLSLLLNSADLGWIGFVGFIINMGATTMFIRLYVEHTKLLNCAEEEK